MKSALLFCISLIFLSYPRPLLCPQFAVYMNLNVISVCALTKWLIPSIYFVGWSFTNRRRSTFSQWIDLKLFDSKSLILIQKNGRKFVGHIEKRKTHDMRRMHAFYCWVQVTVRESQSHFNTHWLNGTHLVSVYRIWTQVSLYSLWICILLCARYVCVYDMIWCWVKAASWLNHLHIPFFQSAVICNDLKPVHDVDLYMFDKI